MAIRIKSHWHNENSDRSISDLAGALAFIIWKIAKDKAISSYRRIYILSSTASRSNGLYYNEQKGSTFICRSSSH